VNDGRSLQAVMSTHVGRVSRPLAGFSDPLDTHNSFSFWRWIFRTRH